MSETLKKMRCDRMDLPIEPLDITEKQFARFQKDVQRHLKKGRKELEKYVQCMRKEGYSDEEIEMTLD